MGMYDTVHFTCPRCDKPIEVQSKTGDSCMLDIDHYAVPQAIADDLSGEEVWCPGCEKLWLIVPINPPKAVTLALVHPPKRT